MRVAIGLPHVTLVVFLKVVQLRLATDAKGEYRLTADAIGEYRVTAEAK